MNYQKIYDQIIQRGKNRKLDGYKEKHHIIPKCMNGSNESQNLVELTGREHFICHKLLTEIYPTENKLHYAVRMMSTMNDMYGRNYKVGNREYSRIKENIKHSELTKLKISIANSNPSAETRKKIGAVHKGKIVSDETRQKISDNSKNINLKTRKKMSESAKNRPPISEKTRNKMSENKTGESNPFYGKSHNMETRKKISKFQTGRKHNEASRIKMSKSAKQNMTDTRKKELSISAKNREHIKCPHCIKIGPKPQMIQWHFDNCKMIVD